VRNLTVVGKFLTLMVLLGSVTACGTLPQQSGSIERSANVDYHDGLGSYITVLNLMKWQRYSLNDRQKQKQNAAVQAALQSDYGVVYNWYETDAMGSVKAVHGYPINSGVCRVIYTNITVKGKSRHFEETACQSSGTQNKWRWQSL